MRSCTQTGVDAADTGLYLPASMWSGTSTSISVTYDVLGNITSKTDIGTYGYGETRAACSSVSGVVTSAGPRAVSSTSGTSNADYCYDANGNLLAGDGRSVTWTAFGKPEQITRGSNTVDISYGPERARYKRVDTSATSTTTTRYIGGKLYEAIDRAGALERKHYIGNFAVITVHVATSVTETRYMLSDHLGSVDTIMEASGAIVERMSFWPGTPVASQRPRRSSRCGRATGAPASAARNRGLTGQASSDQLGPDQRSCGHHAAGDDPRLHQS